MLKRKNRNVELLLVEDNPADVVMMEEVLLDADIDNLNIQTVYDGVEAMAYLNREGIYKEKLLPDLILLDLNIPKKQGHDVLKEIKNDLNLMHIPVIILTTSNSMSDIVKSYRLHANSYIVKPVDPDEFIRMIKIFVTFWCRTASIPSLL